MRISPSLLWMLAGILFGLSFVFVYFWWLFIPAFVLFYKALSHERSYTRIFLFGSLTGLLHYCGVFYWIWSVFPILWLPQGSTYLQFFILGLYWIITSLSEAVVVGLFAVCAKRFLTDPKIALVFLPLLWVVGELIRSISFTLYTLGPGSSVDLSFTYGYIGYLLAQQHALLMYARFGEVYALSYVAALIGVGSYFCAIAISKKNYRVAALYVGAFLLLFSAQALTPKVPMLQQKVISVETYFDSASEQAPDFGSQKLQVLTDAAAKALAQKPDVLVYPEDAHISDGFKSSADFASWARERSGGYPSVIVDNTLGVDHRGVNVIRSELFDTQTGLSYHIDKKHLVPEGEFLSYFHAWVLSFMLPKETIANIREYLRFQNGVEGEDGNYPSYLPGVIHCFDPMVPWSVHDAIRNHAAVVVYQSSLSWFVNSFAFTLEGEHDAMLKTQAVWNQVPIIEAGNMAKSQAYMQDGTIRGGTTIETAQWWSLKEFDL